MKYLIYAYLLLIIGFTLLFKAHGIEHVAVKLLFNMLAIGCFLQVLILDKGE